MWKSFSLDDENPAPMKTSGRGYIGSDIGPPMNHLLAVVGVFIALLPAAVRAIVSTRLAGALLLPRDLVTKDKLQ